MQAASKDVAFTPMEKAKQRRESPLKKMSKVWQLYVLIALLVIYILIFKYFPMYGA